MLRPHAAGVCCCGCLLSAALTCVVTEEIAVIEGIQFLKGDSNDY